MDAASGAPATEAVTLQPAGSGLAGPAILLPFGPEVGAAAFQRDGAAHALFDQAKPLDLSALKDDPVFGGATEQVLPDGMHLRLPLPAPAQLRLSRRGDGWMLMVLKASSQEVGAPDPSLAPITGHLHGGVLSLQANAPGHVIVLDDEATGGRLLVGTQLAAGQRVAAGHQTAEFMLLPSWQGVVIEPVADRLVLRPAPKGFELSSAGPPDLSPVWPEQMTGTWPAGREMTRIFDFADRPAETLRRQLGQALRDAAITPKPARYAPRLAVATAMLAQGMDAEAAGVLHVAAADDPAHQDDPVAHGLSAIALWLSAAAAGQTPSPPGFDPAQLGSSDEATLWRTLLQPDPSDGAARAAALSALWPLVLDYPPNLRRLMLGPVAAVLRAGGQDKALAAFLAACPDPALDIDRAMLLQRQGRTDEALAVLDRVAGRSDRLARSRALAQSVELRLAAHRLAPAEAADLLDRQIYAWRGGEHELHLRERVAELRASSGSWRMALQALREAETVFPDARTQLHAAQIRVVADLVRGGQAGKLNPLDLVALAEAASGLLTPADAESSLAPVLVDKLLALDLPDRAEPILRRLFDRTGDALTKAELGVRLAGLIADRDPAGALAALDASPDDGLPPALTMQRALARARLLVSLGRPADALAVLSGQQGLEAGQLQADILEKQHDWPHAAAALAAAIEAPAFAKLAEPAQRDVILRLARDEGEAGDVTGLHHLREAQGRRFASGQGAELFAVLTADPVRTAADLSRSASEIAEMHALSIKLARR